MTYERPATITAFEWLMLAAILIGFVQLALSYPEIERAADGVTSIALVLTFHFLGIAVQALLTLLVSRLRARFAALILQGLTLVALPMYLYTIFGGEPGLASSLATASVACQLSAILMLYATTSRDWLAEA